ncbi:MULTISPECIES: hypothetical protein [unclassified Janthinobacterium]|uniref:hypothetical protein n=1 Tax=unclassified Janthinobacterium TaxID=2610881 RepID=UPI0012F9E47B|nr:MULTISPECIES: hypothetical protein [unclassified Janthinobacterium]MEC5160774.1 hypothetical protein [Janthinobacterium sp. CG_S6]
MNQDSAAPSGSWTHSFEEDEGGVHLYRPTRSFPFPPSRRGRETLEFGAAGRMLTGVPGPDDRRVLTDAGLTPLGMNRFRLEGGIMPGKVIEIVEAQPDRLKVKYL